MIRVLWLLILGTIAGCNSNTIDESADKKLAGEADTVGVCSFLKNTGEPLMLDSFEILPIQDVKKIDSSLLIDSITYTKYLQNTEFFKGNYHDYLWITAQKTQGFNKNVYLISYAKVKGDNQTDNYLIVFSSNCEVRDGLHVASYNKFHTGSTLKTTLIYKDTLLVKSVITDEGDFDPAINRKHISKNEVVRKYFFYSDKQIFMMKD